MSRILHAVLTDSETEGIDRTVLIVLAACADFRGQIAISNREIAAFARVGKSSVPKIIARLESAGALRIVAAGGKRDQPTVYEVVSDDDGWADISIAVGPSAGTIAEIVTNDAESASVIPPRPTLVDPPRPVPPAIPSPRTTVIPDCFPQNDVGRLLSAAGLASVPDEAPWQWFRAEHLGEVSGCLKEMQCTSVGEAVAALLRARSKKGPIKAARRLSDLVGWAR